MKKKFPLPLKINCEGLSRKLIDDLADQLRIHFRDVRIWEDEITAANPLGGMHYEIAWRIIDRFGVYGS